jgi:hypothetical protein
MPTGGEAIMRTIREMALKERDHRAVLEAANLLRTAFPVEQIFI